MRITQNHSFAVESFGTASIKLSEIIISADTIGRISDIQFNLDGEVPMVTLVPNTRQGTEPDPEPEE